MFTYATIAPDIPKPPTSARKSLAAGPLLVCASSEAIHVARLATRAAPPADSPDAFLRRAAQQAHRCVAIRLATYGKRLRFAVIFAFRRLATYGISWQSMAVPSTPLAGNLGNPEHKPRRPAPVLKMPKITRRLLGIFGQFSRILRCHPRVTFRAS
jgi:hypothetical protein